MPAAIAGALFTAGTVGYAVTYLAVTLAINFGLSRLAQSLAGKPKSLRQDAGRDVTIRSTAEPMQMLYGQIRAAGYIAFYGTSGDRNQYLHFVVAWAAHQCEAIDDYWLDARHILPASKTGGGGPITANWNDNGTSTSMLHAWDHLGTSAQTADATLVAAITAWTTSHRGAGVCYTHFRLEYSEHVFPDGAPQNLFALVKGRRLYDPRLDSTNGGSGSHRYDDATTWAYSNNWALCVRDYITGGSRWYDVATPEKRLGFGEADTRIDDTFVIAAANKSDEDVAIPPAIPATTQKRYTCDTQLSCGAAFKENLDILKTAGVGNVTYVNGKYRIYAGAYDTPVVEITEDDVLGDVDIATHPRGESVYNAVSGTFFDEARDWQQATFPTITNSSYETADGGQKVRTIELFATRTSYRCQRIGILHNAQSRQKQQVRFSALSFKAMRITQWETFFVTLPEFGWNQKVFRCIDWEWDPTTGFPALTAREESVSAYTDPDVATYATGQDATVETPAYDLPVTPTSLEARSMPNGIAFRWVGPTPVRTDQVYHLYEHTAQTPFSSATRVWSGQSLAVLLDRADYTTRYYWVTASLNGQESSATPAGNGLAASWKGEDTVAWAVDALGKPAGIRGVEGITDRSQLQFGGIGIQILGSPDADAAYGFPAIPIDDTATYQLTIRHKSSASSASGLYLYFNELNTALPSGKTHVGAASGESVVTPYSSYVAVVSNGPMPGTTTVENVYIYTPTSGARFASLGMYNWTSFTGTYEIEWVRLTRVGSNVNLLGRSAFSTQDLIPGAATAVYSTTDVGPITIELNAPSTLALERVLYVEFTIAEPATIEVSAMCRLGVTGSGHTIKTSAYYGTPSTPVIAADQITEKTDNVYENLALIGTFNIATAGTYRAGLTCVINGDGMSNVDAIYRDVSVRVTEIRR